MVERTRVVTVKQRDEVPSQPAKAASSDRFDLDWELQRLLGEELLAMEPEERTPAPSPAAAPAVIPSAPNPSQPGAVPAASAATPSSPAAARVEVTRSAEPAAAAEPMFTAPSAPAVDEQLQARLQSLTKDIDALYQQMTREVGARSDTLEDVAGLLQQARAALLRGPDGFTEAEKLTMQAQGLLRRKEESRRWAATYGTIILGYEFLFFITFVLVLAFDRPLAAWVGSVTHVTEALNMRDILPFWDTMIWGGIGGVVGALYSLYWHVAEQQDFDRQYNMWYVVQPVMGAMLGAFIYLIVVSGMLAMSINIQTVSSSWFPSALACLCGFRQKFILELLDKLVEVIGLRPILSKVGGKEE
ncbi:MAG: hypothetical protein ACP5TV_03935 [Anaerolineae bacterium]